MRIVGGEFKGRNLLAPKTLNIRPALSQIRENIFNILANVASLEEAKVLDLFSGCGTLGLEALSRGASQVTFVDSANEAVHILKRNTAFCREHTRGEPTRGEQVRIIPADVHVALTVLAKKGEKFNFIFVDPPYEKNLVEKTVKKIDDLSLLSEEGFLIVRAHKRETIGSEWKNLILQDKRQYGDAIVWFLRWKTK